jgi:hypothetical protein
MALGQSTQPGKGQAGLASALGISLTQPTPNCEEESVLTKTLTGVLIGVKEV